MNKLWAGGYWEWGLQGEGFPPLREEVAKGLRTVEKILDMMVTRGRCCPIITMGQAQTPGGFQNLKWALRSPLHTLTPRLFLKVLRVPFLGPWGLSQKTLEGPSPVSLFPEREQQ